MDKATLLITVCLWVGYIAERAASYEDCPPKAKYCDYHSDCSWHHACIDGYCVKCHCAEKSQCRYDYYLHEVYCNCSDSVLKGPYCCCNYSDACHPSDCCSPKYTFFNKCEKYRDEYQIYNETKVDFERPVTPTHTNIAIDVESCESSCSANPRCNVFVYSSENKACVLYNVNNFITNLGSFHENKTDFYTGFRKTKCDYCNF